jgi:hypothetical protein
MKSTFLVGNLFTELNVNKTKELIYNKRREGELENTQFFASQVENARAQQ